MTPHNTPEGGAMSDQGMRQKPGEYTGTDGRTYRWVKSLLSDRYYVIDDGSELVGVDLSDRPAARAALDALVEQEADMKARLVGLRCDAVNALQDARLQMARPGSGWDNASLIEHLEKLVEHCDAGLALQESGEWVGIGYGVRGKGLRISRDGSQVQFEVPGGAWVPAVDDYPAADGYRKGREVAQQESTDLRDAARELVDEAVRLCAKCGGGGPHDACFICVLYRVRKAAKALEGKL